MVVDILKYWVFLLILSISIIFQMSGFFNDGDPQGIMQFLTLPIMSYIYLSKHLIYLYLFAKILDIIIEKTIGR